MKILIYTFLFLLPFNLLSQEYNKEVLEEIIGKTLQTNSDGTIIYQDGKIVYRYFENNKERPIYIASAGKSLVSMAIGKLLDDGLLDSLDQPVHTLFPEWKQGQKKYITIRMLLNHTSGLQDFPNASLEVEPAPEYKNDNIIKLALAAELQTPPAKNLFYSNKATALLGGVIEKASGKRMDKYFEVEFYRPLGIEEYDWIRDKSGNPTAHGAFILKPSDLLKFGIVMLNKGVYKDIRILSEGWVSESVKPGQEFDPIWGLMWWRKPVTGFFTIDDEIIDDWRKLNLSPEIIELVEPIVNKTYQSIEAMYDELEKLSGKDVKAKMIKEIPYYVSRHRRIFSEEIKGYYADGYRGNYLVIIPEKKLVAVRVADHDGFNYDNDTFREFIDLVTQL